MLLCSSAGPHGGWPCMNSCYSPARLQQRMVHARSLQVVYKHLHPKGSIVNDLTASAVHLVFLLAADVSHGSNAPARLICAADVAGSGCISLFQPRCKRGLQPVMGKKLCLAACQYQAISHAPASWMDGSGCSVHTSTCTCYLVFCADPPSRLLALSSYCTHYTVRARPLL